jgi:hypothetical protein
MIGLVLFALLLTKIQLLYAKFAILRLLNKHLLLSRVKFKNKKYNKKFNKKKYMFLRWILMFPVKI